MAKIFLLTRTEDDGLEFWNQLLAEGHWVTWSSGEGMAQKNYPCTAQIVDYGCALAIGYNEEDGRSWMGTDLSKVLTCIE